jgi:hypothetical protein
MAVDARKGGKRGEFYAQMREYRPFIDRKTQTRKEKQMSTRKWLTVSGTVMLAILALVLVLSASNSAQASPPLQGPDGENEDRVLLGPGEISAVDNTIVYQGRLTDNGGSPINATLDITLTMYADSGGTTQLCWDRDNNQVIENGLFTFVFNGTGSCTPDDINGRQIYLGVQVEGDDEMAPSAIYPVPYAWSLMPGAIIQNDANDEYVLWVENAYDNDSADAVGLVVRGDPAGIFTGTVQAGITEAAYGVVAQGGGLFGTGGKFTGGTYGIHAEGGLGGGGWFESSLGLGIKVDVDGGTTGIDVDITGSGDALVLTSNTGNLIEGYGGGSEIDFRVEDDGAAYADGGWNGAADFAELIDTEDDPSAYEPGDVMVISTASDRTVDISSVPYSTAVIGIYSENPGFVGSPHVMEGQQDDEIPVAIVGIVPCKVSAENGSIQRGDLLVTSSVPGHAMRAGASPPQGTVLGKALGELEEGTGVIEVLVVLQ